MKTIFLSAAVVALGWMNPQDVRAVMALLAPMQRDVVKPGFVAPGTQKPPANVK
jgi:hypothetical protein